jgi:hypothetical protein
VVFLAAGRTAWPLPLYELALMTAARAPDDSPGVGIGLITTERAPLQIFGDEASHIDRHCRVRGTENVFAAGDATDFAVKHGGIAAQQADVVADSIAALAGAPVSPTQFRPTIHGILLTGGEPCYLSARLTGGHPFGSELRAEPTWAPASKVAARHLGPFLEQLGYEA